MARVLTALCRSSFSNMEKREQTGFTLIELSIVLVIIGLIIGGVLVGQDLINAAGVRAQISQIDKYNAAVNTFQGKYGYLPGDIPDPVASQYGFGARGGGAQGEGDGNGLIEGIIGGGIGQGGGETAMFWVDLSTAQLIEGGFNSAASTHLAWIPCACIIIPPYITLYLPPAKIGVVNDNHLFPLATIIICQ